MNPEDTVQDVQEPENDRGPKEHPTDRLQNL